ncbi:MAG TPA: methionine synthase [Spongiibacteraceae bacterium]
MSQHDPIPTQSSQGDSDGKADALAAVAIIALVVGAVVFWLKSM